MLHHAEVKPDNNTTKLDNMKDFMAKFLVAELMQHLRSAEVPEDWDRKGVMVLVDKKFHGVAMNAKRDVLVLVLVLVRIRVSVRIKVRVRIRGQGQDLGQGQD